MYTVKTFSYFCNHKGYKHKKIETAKISFYHLTFVLEGTITYTVNGEKVVLNQNDAMLLVPGTIRKRFPSEELAHYVIFNYTAAKGNDIPSNLFFKNAVNQTIRKLLDVYPYTYYRAADHLTSPSRGNSKINTVLPNLFNCVLTELFDSMNYSTKNIHVLNAIKYINDNITRSLSLSDVSEFLHITKEYTAKLFKRELGMTASEFINKQKVTLAKDMLTNDAMSLAEIASCLGYENYGYFSNVFKDFFGISPISLKNELMNR